MPDTGYMFDLHLASSQLVEVKKFPSLARGSFCEANFREALRSIFGQTFSKSFVKVFAQQKSF